MSILQRCLNKNCRNYFPVSEQRCKFCGYPAQRGARNLYFRVKINGKRHFKAIGSKTLDEARLLYAQWFSEINNPVLQNDKITLREISERYLEKLKVEGKNYHKMAKLFLERMLIFWGDIRATNVTAEMVKQFQTYLRGAGCSPAYCDRHIAIGKAALNYVIPDVPNPFKRVKMYNPDNTLKRSLTEDEENRLLEAAKTYKNHCAPKNLYELILTAIHTGMRKSNVLQLHTDQVNLEERIIRVRQKRDLTLEIVIDDVLASALKRIWPEGGGYFFPNPRTGKPCIQMEKTFRRLKQRSEITRPFRFHDLRHHAATKLAKATGSPLIVKEALGHRNIQTSMKYIDHMKSEVRKALEAIYSGHPKGHPNLEKD